MQTKESCVCLMCDQSGTKVDSDDFSVKNQLLFHIEDYATHVHKYFIPRIYLDSDFFL